MNHSETSPLINYPQIWKKDSDSTLSESWMKVSLCKLVWESLIIHSITSPFHNLNHLSSFLPSHCSTNSSPSFSCSLFEFMAFLSFSLLIALFRKLCMQFSSHSPSISCLLYSLSSTLAHFICFTPSAYPIHSHLLSSLHLTIYSSTTSFRLPGWLTEREIG